MDAYGIRLHQTSFLIGHIIGNLKYPIRAANNKFRKTAIAGYTLLIALTAYTVVDILACFDYLAAEFVAENQRVLNQDAVVIYMNIASAQSRSF